jgi:hypothetical protein
MASTTSPSNVLGSPPVAHVSLPSFREAFPDFYVRSAPPHRYGNDAAHSPSIGSFNASPRSERRGSDYSGVTLLPPFSTIEQHADGITGELNHAARRVDRTHSSTGSPLPLYGILGSAFASRRASADESVGSGTLAGTHSPLVPAPLQLQHRSRLPAGGSGVSRPIGGGSQGHNSDSSAWSSSDFASTSPASSVSSPVASPVASLSSLATPLLSPVLHATRGPTRVGKKAKGGRGSWPSAPSSSGAAAAVAAVVAAVAGDDADAGTAVASASPRPARKRDQKNSTEKARRTNSTAWMREMQCRLEGDGRWTGSLLSQANHRKSKGLLKYNKLEIMEGFVNKFDEMEREVKALQEPRDARCGSCAGCDGGDGDGPRWLGPRV